MISSSQITAVILSGGAGRRFGGIDKGLQEHAGKPLIEYVIAAIEPQVSELLICVNRNADRYAQYGYEVLMDDTGEYQGPLAGITTALTSSKLIEQCAAILVSSCDSPNLSKDYVASLTAALNGHQVAVVHDGQRRQNLHCLITRAAWPSLIDFFEQGGRAMHRWFEGANMVEVDFAHSTQVFRNVNVPQDLNN